MLHGVVVAALLGERLSARDDSAHAQPLARFQDVIVRVNDDAVWFWPPERLHGKGRFLAGNLDGLEFRIALGFDLHLDVHAEEIEVLLDLADDSESFLGAVGHVFQVNSGTPVERSHCVKKGRRLGASAAATGGVAESLVLLRAAGCATCASAICSKSWMRADLPA